MKVCYLFSGHLPGCTGPTIPGPHGSLCPPLTCSLHCSPMCCRRKNTYSSTWVEQSCCLGYNTSQIRCLSSCEKPYSEQPRLLLVQATQGGISLTPSLCFHLSPSPFQLPQAMPTTTCPPFMWTHLQTVWLYWENWTVSLVTLSGQTCWAGVLKTVTGGTLCFS